ncbi:MAG TPA: hypothetical protein VKV20_08065 [Ktedonobacteraceae bacterium]|jgi:WD40 repeat protein|nr:hypothetical protein [Ktedonobacteraceae bacterium]
MATGKAERQQENQRQNPRCDVLLVTATDVETGAVRDIFLQETGIFKQQKINGVSCYDLGTIGAARIFLVQSEMGATGPRCAALVAHDAIKALSPSAIVMVGIAFGLLPQSQQIGDILVSEQLFGYERQKVDVDPAGRLVIRARGDRPHASTRLLDSFRDSSNDWAGCKVHFGLMLSGEKLVNNRDFRDSLLRMEPEAIGGEMEGTGIYSAARRNSVDWILVKAISDWADGYKVDTHQRRAAENAVSFTTHTLARGGLAGHTNGTGLASPPLNVILSPYRQAMGTVLRTYDIHSSWVVALAWEPGGDHIASAGGDGLVRVWEVATGHTLLTYRGHRWRFERVNWPPTIYNIAWSPEGLRLASAGDGTKVYVWDATTGQTITVYEGHSGLLPNVFALAWSPSGKRIATACSSIDIDKTIHIWDPLTGQKALSCDSGYGLLPNFSVLALAWSPDGTRIAWTCGDKTIRIWEATTGQPLSTWKVRSPWVSNLSWSPDSQYLALANSDHTAQVWHAQTGKAVVTYHGHHDSVRDIAWSPDGSRLATASNDTTVQLWDPASGTHIYTYRGHTKWATSLAWSPDGTALASASNDMSVQIWQAI